MVPFIQRCTRTETKRAYGCGLAPLGSRRVVEVCNAGCVVVQSREQMLVEHGDGVREDADDSGGRWCGNKSGGSVRQKLSENTVARN